MKALLSRWGRRWIAGLLAIAMLSGMIPTALASETPLDTTSDTETELLLEAASETTAESVPETTAETVPETTAETVQETTAETVPETTAESVPETTAATVPETTAETESEEELSEEELEELLQLEGGEMALFSTRSSETVQDATPGISLNDAIEIAERIADGKQSLSVNEDGEIIVLSSADLILLSYVDPSVYCNCTINLSLLDGIDYFNLVTPVKDTVEQTTTDENGTTATTVTIMQYSFQGLGGNGAAFSGTIATESPKPIRTARALFNNLSKTATLPPTDKKIKFDIQEQAVNGPVLAQNVEGDGEVNWEIGLSGSASIGGIIGTMTGGTVTLEAELSNWKDSESVSQGTILTCTGNPNAGFFCNTMTDGTLNATLSGTGSVSVTAESGSAGGFVGSIDGGTLTASIGENAKITGVTAENGNAGGLVGMAVNSVVATQTGYTLSDITVKGKNAGGLIGSCTGWNNATNTIDLSNFTFAETDKKLTLSGDTAGGVFGALTNSGGTLTITTTAEGDKAITSTSTAATYGGLIGTYSASTEGGLKDSLEINSLTVKSTRTGESVYGGIIGTVPSTCYVKMSGLTANTSASSGTFGGLVAEAGSDSAVLLDVNKVDISSGNLTGSVTGGLVGRLSKGVLRLDGAITVPDIAPDEKKGRIVGENGAGLVYAVSTCALPTSGDASNIGNWGEVVRLDGTTLTGDNTGGNLFYLDPNTHTLTINNPAASGGTYTLSGTADFAGYALAYNYDVNDVLKFAEDVDSTSSQSVTLTGSVVLTGTGILGIGRDNGGSSAFTGTFDGGGYTTITLDIGDTAGKLWARQKKSDPDSHGYLGLFARVGNGAQIQNVTVAGTVKMSVLNGTDGNANENPLRVAGLVAHQVGSVSYNAVTASAAVTVDTDVTNTPYVMQAGMVAFCDENSTLNFTDCNWTSTLTNSRTNSNDRSGGFLAHTKGGITLTAENCTLSGNINHSNKTSDARVGGLVADIEENSTNPSQITLKNLTVSATVSAAKAGTNNYCGGLLGCHWYSTNVVFVGDGEKGVTVSGASLNAGSAQFGGLVYQATGHWDATADNSILFTKKEDETKTTITATTGDHRGLLVGDGLHDAPKKALYLEVGTWGEEGTAYWIDSSNVRLVDANGTPLSGQFDELVGAAFYGKSDNKPASPGFYENNNAIISLTTKDTTEIDNGTCNTYTKQLTNVISNYQARYYYNLSNMSDTETAPSTLTTAQQVTTWSASQFAASNIRTILYAGANNPVTISNEGNTAIDLTHYSYYPVSPLSTVTVQNATLKFGFDVIEGVEEGNKKPSESKQHYLMQCGLLYNTTRNVTVENVTLSGVVGKTTNGSGALIYGKVTGDTTKSPVTVPTVKLSNVTLEGLRVNDVGDYAPLLINKIGHSVKLSVSELSTGTGYTGIAATSLIGHVGSTDATKLSLTFDKIALDGRKTPGETTVYNNGTQPVQYNTASTIFSHATLLESFKYASDSVGTYNFVKSDTKVTYGVELSNSGTSGRNPDKQYQYYDGGYITDEQDKTDQNAAYVRERYKDSNFIRYVYVAEGGENNAHELDINQKTVGLTSGCGTYGDPYLIDNPDQLIALEKYLNETTRASVADFQVKFNSKVLDEQTQTENSYHCAGDTLAPDTTGTDDVYTCDGGTWKNDAGVDANGEFLLYLQNAYYQIQKDITIDLSTTGYTGLGTKDTPFSGVIVGLTGNNETVSLSGTKTGLTDFGGLIRYSRGSVVKDLAVDYSNAQITMTNGAVTNFTNNPFFGGIVGYCMGGDTIIDNVSVNYGQGSVTLSGSYARMIAAGGYVGLVGGANDSDNYEKNGGGVVFRNMDNAANSFATFQTNARENSGYFYCNPYVGRVLDGYACYETSQPASHGHTLDNTDKNYTIPDIVPRTNDLTVVAGTNGANYDVTVTSAQGLWLLSAIVNSGASAMDSSGNYQDGASNKYVDAYYYGKPRAALYNHIGDSGYTKEEALRDTVLGDEVIWGGIEGANHYSYLIQKYIAVDNQNAAARITGSAGSADVNNTVNLRFTAGTIDMSPYGNGFRGIGASYGFGHANGIFDDKGNNGVSYNAVMRRTIYAKTIIGGYTGNTEGEGNASSNSAITTFNLDMHQKLYFEEVNNREAKYWANHGVGLFTNLGLPSGGCVASNLGFTGLVQIGYYQKDNGTTETKCDRISGESGAGAFAAKILYNTSAVTLTMNNLHLTDLSVAGAANTGGAIGCVSRNMISLVINSVTANNVSVWAIFNDDGNVGGIVGYFAPQGGGSCTIGSENVKSTFTDIDVRATVTNQQYVSLGTLIAKSEQKAIYIKNCEISETESTKNIVYTTNGRQCGGLIGCAGGGGTIEKVIINGMTVKSDNISLGTGGLIGTSEKNDQHLSIKDVTVNNLTVIGKAQKTGGFVGGLTENKNATIQDCSVSNLTVKSGNEKTGGLVGYHNYSKLNIWNVALSNATVVSTKNNTGLLVGNTNSKPVNGYNILAKDCATGKVDKLDSWTKFTDDTKAARWVGDCGSSTTTLVAVSATASVMSSVTGNILPNRNVGSGTEKVVYADYPVVQTYQPTTGSASPYVDVNPKIDVTVKESANSTTATTLTGNGVGYHTVTSTTTDVEGQETTTSTNQSVAKTILEEVTKPNKRYFNLVDGDRKTFSKFLNKEEAAYLTTYQAEEGAITNVPSGVDFPILVLASNADADEMLWTYIAALTNVSSGDVAKSQASEISASTCTWNENSFVKGNPICLSVGRDKKTVSIEKNRYDNQLSRFTLLDVSYQNPVETSKYFHLYVPVLVKKVLRVKYTIQMLAGTNYYADGYSGAAYYATANFNEPVTALIEYTYDRPIAEWNDALNNGEDLLWHYKKVFDLKSNGTNLPMGTRLTLVDVATGKAHFYTMQGDQNNNYFDCEDKLGFSPLPICDYLEISVSETGETTAFVATASEYGATVKVGDTYYRPATPEEISNSKIEKRYLTVGGMKRERYFLTIQVPETAGITFINNLLDLPGSAMVRTENAPPAVKEQEYNNGRYVLYDGVAQSNFTIKTERVGGSGTEMTGGDAIRVQLSSELRLTDAAKARYREGYKPVDLNHRFTIDLKKVVGGNTTESVLGVTGISWNYTVVGKDGQELGTSGQRTYTPGELDSFSVSSGSYFNAGNMVTWIEKYEPLKVKAEIILQYGNNVGSVFPARTGENSSDGSYVHAESRVANAESQLPITANKLKADGQELYYCVTPSSASLTFDAIEPSGGEKTLQLGINSDDDYQPRIIQTDSIYDYSEVDPVTVSKAKYVRYTLELFRKQDNGLYNGDAVSPINDYLPIVRKAGEDPTSTDESKMTWIESLDEGATCDSTSFDFVPLTGAAFEEKGFTYANYMIRLTAELLEEKQDNGTIVKEVLPGTLASDYIVYTNARVLQKIPDERTFP